MTNEPSAQKPTDEWVTGDEPMTGPQRSYLETLAREAGEEVPGDLTKAAASEMIDRLQQVTGRGASNDAGGTGGASGASSGSGSSAGGGKSGANASSGGHQETLGERVEREGIVDQQAIVASQTNDD